MATPSDATHSTSRRSRPSARRAAAVDAFIDLVLEHDGEHPRPERVAERAGVSIASLYRYFADLDELRRDALERLVERFPDLFVIPDVGTGERAARIASFVDARVALHEKLHPLQLLARAEGHADPAVATHVDAARAAMADQGRLHFDIELRPLRPGARTDTVAAIAALTSVESWEQYRRSFGLSPSQTRRAWRLAIDALLPNG